LALRELKTLLNNSNLMHLQLVNIQIVLTKGILSYMFRLKKAVFREFYGQTNQGAVRP